MLILCILAISIDHLSGYCVYSFYRASKNYDVKISSSRYIPIDRFAVFPQNKKENIKFVGLDLYFNEVKIHFPIGKNCFVIYKEEAISFANVEGVADTNWIHMPIFGLRTKLATFGRNPIYKIDEQSIRNVIEKQSPD